MGNRLARRGTALLVVVAALLALSAPPAGAVPVPVSGTFTATGTFTFACDFAQESTDGSGDWSGLGPVTFHLDWCVGLPPQDQEAWPVSSGSFTVTAAAGTLSGAMGGEVMGNTPGPDGRFPFALVLTVTGGTGDYAAATGTLTLDGLLEYVPTFSRNLDGTVSGTIEVAVRTPTSKADCRHGNWRNLTDETGTPFASMAGCIRWVKRHL
ncbi:MAG TPA: hypothetical protein VFI47_23135 [Acidimicrobiales bacterium]|nr:hypothetical protein [Acidimicrobiales bacterium]